MVLHRESCPRQLDIPYVEYLLVFRTFPYPVCGYTEHSCQIGREVSLFQDKVECSVPDRCTGYVDAFSCKSFQGEPGHDVAGCEKRVDRISAPCRVRLAVNYIQVSDNKRIERLEMDLSESYSGINGCS